MVDVSNSGVVIEVSMYTPVSCKMFGLCPDKTVPQRKTNMIHVLVISMVGWSVGFGCFRSNEKSDAFRASVLKGVVNPQSTGHLNKNVNLKRTQQCHNTEVRNEDVLCCPTAVRVNEKEKRARKLHIVNKRPHSLYHELHRPALLLCVATIFHSCLLKLGYMRKGSQKGSERHTQ